MLWTLYKVFARIGLFTFGGGYAMLPMLERELVDTYGWITTDEMMDYYAVGQSTPGIIAVNTATLVGYKKKGVIGGIVATLGMVTPSLVIILILANVIQRFSHMAVACPCFFRYSYCRLCFGAQYGDKNVSQQCEGWICVGIFLCAYVAGLFQRITSWMVLGAALAGLIRGGYHDQTVS